MANDGARTMIGVDTGLQWTRQCPLRMALRSFKARASDTVNIIEITCQDYQSPEDLVFSFLFPLLA